MACHYWAWLLVLHTALLVSIPVLVLHMMVVLEQSPMAVFAVAGEQQQHNCHNTLFFAQPSVCMAPGPTQRLALPRYG